MLKVILADAAAPRCRVVDRRRWAVGTRGWGEDRERGLQGISATSWIKSLQAPVAGVFSPPLALAAGGATRRQRVRCSRCRVGR
jgi:hypothetical protein